MKSYNLLRGLLGSLFAAFLLLGCSSTQSLQEYYIDNAENPNFLALDVPANIVKLDETSLDETQLAALKSLRKLNILAFRKTEENTEAYTQESAKVREILKNSDFKELMKLNMGSARGTIKYLGEGDAIDEVVIFGDSKEEGFALIRVLGDDMNPAHIMQLMQSVQKADMNGEVFQQFADMLKS